MSATGRLVAPLLFALIVAATIGVLVVSQRARGQLLVDQVELTNVFDPTLGERATIRFRLTEDEPSATVEVIDDAGSRVATLAEGASLGDFEIHRFHWGGASSEPGGYRVVLTLDSLDREIVLPERIELNRRRDG